MHIIFSREWRGHLLNSRWPVIIVYQADSPWYDHSFERYFFRFMLTFKNTSHRVLLIHTEFLTRRGNRGVENFNEYCFKTLQITLGTIIYLNGIVWNWSVLVKAPESPIFCPMGLHRAGGLLYGLIYILKNRDDLGALDIIIHLNDILDIFYFWKSTGPRRVFAHHHISAPWGNTEPQDSYKGCYIPKNWNT